MIKLKSLIIEIFKKTQFSYREYINENFYTDIGHDDKSILWVWFNDGERFLTRPSDILHAQWPQANRSDYEGRYDKEKNIVSIVDMSSIKNLNGFDISTVPENLMKRLKFEFGDETKFKTYEESSKQLNESKLEMPVRIPPKMYHGTIESRGNRIWKYGLSPVRTRNYEWSEKGVYLTTNPSVAKAFGEAGNSAPENAQQQTTSMFRQSSESVVIVTVNTKGLDPKKFRVDPNASNSLVYFGIIPAKNIEDWKQVEDGDNVYD